MQIRVANRQDEKEILAFVEQIYDEKKQKLELFAADADLRNVEVNYFGRDGVFLIAEADKKIIGIASANMIDEDVLALRRIYVARNFRGQAIGSQMLAMIISVAGRLMYKKLVVSDCLSSQETKILFDKFGFSATSDTIGAKSGRQNGLVELVLS